MSNAETAVSGGQHPMATLRAVLAEIGWDAMSEEQNDNIFVDLDVEDVLVSYAHAAISDELQQFVFYLMLALVPTVDRRDECALLITRINHDILVGGFDLDFDTGRFCFKNGVSFHGSALQEQQIRNVILGSMQAVELYADAIVAVANGQSSQDALRQWHSAHPNMTHRSSE
jgi:hypothetical protein